MARHTNAGARTKRTRKDLRKLADVSDTYGKIDDSFGRDRLLRLADHGWVAETGDGWVETDAGDKLGRAAARLRDDGVIDDDLSYVLDIFGVAGFVDATTDAETVEDAVRTFGVTLSAANAIDDARHRAGTQDAEPDHAGLFAPHVAAVDTTTRSIDLSFERTETADAFVDLWNAGFMSTVAVRHAADAGVTIGPK